MCPVDRLALPLSWRVPPAVYDVGVHHGRSHKAAYHGNVAQMARARVDKPEVAGSSPAIPAITRKIGGRDHGNAGWN